MDCTYPLYLYFSILADKKIHIYGYCERCDETCKYGPLDCRKGFWSVLKGVNFLNNYLINNMLKKYFIINYIDTIIDMIYY